MSKTSSSATCHEINTMHTIAQRALYETDSVIAVLSRLKGIKKIHDESPDLQTDINKIGDQEKEIQVVHDDNKKIVIELKSEMNKEFAQIFKDLEQCEKDISLLKK